MMLLLEIDEVLFSLKGKVSNSLLYDLISFESSPHRDKDNKWYIISEEQEWPPASYLPWVHCPGYVVSKDIARFIVQGHQKRDLQVFKLEDVAFGIWIEEFKKHGHKVHYISDEHFHNAGGGINVNSFVGIVDHFIFYVSSFETEILKREAPPAMRLLNDLLMLHDGFNEEGWLKECRKWIAETFPREDTYYIQYSCPSRLLIRFQSPMNHRTVQFGEKYSWFPEIGFYFPRRYEAAAYKSVMNLH